MNRRLWHLIPVRCLMFILLTCLGLSTGRAAHTRVTLILSADTARPGDTVDTTLLEASARVPRLREFGGDGRRRTQDEPVGATGAVAMSWSFQGLGHQISE